MKQLVAAAAQMRAVGIFHRDLRAENILLEDDEAASPQVRIADFGCGYFVSSGYHGSTGGCELLLGGGLLQSFSASCS